MSGGTRAPTRASARRSSPAGRRLRTPRLNPWLLVALLGLVIVGLVITMLVESDDPERSPATRDGLAGPAVGRVVGPPFPIGTAPSAIAIGTESIWVLNEVDGTAVVSTRPRTPSSATPSRSVGGRDS